MDRVFYWYEMMNGIQQQYTEYTEEDRLVWNTLFTRQINNLQAKASGVYLDCLQQLQPVLNADVIPHFERLNAQLHQATGWRVTVVPGLIPVDDFFALLAERKFCSSTWLRRMEQLDYLEEPDMFHDIFGHIPLLMHAPYAHFMEQIGKLGVQYRDHPEIVVQLQRLYWFTIEFGLVMENGQLRIYGAGILSSFGESKHVYDATVAKVPYQLNEVLQRDFTSTEIQDHYAVLADFEELFADVEQLTALLQPERVAPV